MKKTSLYFFLPILLAALASCTKDADTDPVPPPQPAQKTDIWLYAVQQQTRAGIEQKEDGYSSVWQYADRIGVFVNNMWRIVENNTVFTIDNLRQGQTTQRGRFTAAVKDTADIFAYYAYYPASEGNADPHEIIASLGYIQNAQSDGPDPAANFMTARPVSTAEVSAIGSDASGSSSIELSFSRAFALWNITLDNIPDGEKLEYVTVSSKSGRVMAGKFATDITDSERFDDNAPVTAADFYMGSPAIKANMPSGGKNAWIVLAPSTQADEGDGYTIRAVTQTGVATASAVGFAPKAGGIYADTLTLSRMKRYILFEDFGVTDLQTPVYMDDYNAFSRIGTSGADVEYSSGAARIMADKTGEGAFARIDAGDALSLEKINVKGIGTAALCLDHKGSEIKISVSGDGISWKDAGTLTPHTDWTSTEVTLPAWSGSQLWLKLAAQSTSASVDNIGIYTFAENVSTLVLDKDSITVDNTVDRYVATVRADRDFTVRASEQWITVPQGTVAAGDNVSVTLGFTQNSGTVRSAEVYFTTTDETCTDTLKISQMGRPFHTGHKMLSFGFSKKNNPALKEDIVLSSDGDGFSGRIPYITDVKNLIPTFSSSTMSRVTVNGKEQTSGVTALDFIGKVTYTVTSESGDSTRYEISLIHFTGLPILYINTATGNPVASKSNWEGATLRIEGGPDFDGYPLGEIYVKGRGNSSWGTFTKKQSYNIKLPERSKMLGMPKHKRWSLIGNYRDKTLLRNQVSMELGRKTDLAWVPRGVQVELVLNGTHRGTYLLSEQIRIDKNRVAINEMQPTDTDPQAIEGGYVMEWDQYGDSDVKSFYSQYVTGTLTSGKKSKINVKIPSIEDGNSAQFAYIENHFRQAEEAVCNNGGDFSEAYDKYIDINSFADFWMVYEISATPEPARGPYSFYMYKDKGDSHFYAGPLWDFDFLSYVQSTATAWVNKNAGWYRFLFTDPEFMAVVKSRWNSHKAGFYEVLESYIETQQKYLELSAEENWKLYDLAERGENGDEHISSEAAISRMKTVLRQRLNWMDLQINSWTSNTASGGIDPIDKDSQDKDKDGFWK